MTIIINDLNINYIQYGEGEDVVLLHGWGQNIEMMKPLSDKIINKKITIVDLPGFGLSQEPLTDWNILNYSEFLKELLIKLNINNPVIIGHSFGGRIAIVYAALNKVNKLVLFGSPCVRIKKKTTLKENILKTLIKVPGLNLIGEYAKNFIGAIDYKNAKGIMRKILVKIVNEDLSEYAEKIKVPTLLIWGSNDQSAPLNEAKLLDELISDSGLIVLEGLSHYAYLEDLNRVSKILKEFI